MAGKALSQGQVQISWQAQHFRKVGAMLSQVRCRFRGRRSTFARCGTDFAASAALSQGQVQISWQAQYFRKVRHKFRSRRSTLARSGTDSRQVQDFCKAGATLSQEVPISRQAQHFRKVGGTEFDAGAAFTQAVKKNIQRYKHEEKTEKTERERERERERKKEIEKESDDRGSDDSAKGALSFVYILKISGGVGGGGCRPPP